jgi:hypothetical protein
VLILCGQIRGVRFSPALMPTGFIEREHEGTACDMLVTCGEKHLKFWSLQRPRTRDNRCKFCCFNRVVMPSLLTRDCLGV